MNKKIINISLFGLILLILIIHFFVYNSQLVNDDLPERICAVTAGFKCGDYTATTNSIYYTLLYDMDNNLDYFKIEFIGSGCNIIRQEAETKENCESACVFEYEYPKINSKGDVIGNYVFEGCKNEDHAGFNFNYTYKINEEPFFHEGGGRVSFIIPN